MAILHDQKDQVRDASDLVRLVGEHVALRPKGREFVGLCPFHDDKSPSMFVSPQKQIYKCFSCNAGGDAFSWMMNYHKMSFPEALSFLAERAGITLEKPGRSGAGQSPGQSAGAGVSSRRQMLDACERAAAFFRRRFEDPKSGQAARDYAEKRGMSPETLEAFNIGYAPDDWDVLARSAARAGSDLAVLEKAGLISPRKNGQGYYDRFRHRLIFPICDALGRPIAFGGRKLREEDEPKYLNSPETPLFNKSATLFGLHLAQKSIIASKTAVVVEGYTDVTACHQADQRNVVATLGTALTPQHAKLLQRYAERVVLIFDADEAGAKAAERAVEVFLTEQIDVAIATLPTGADGAKMDPAELLGLPEGPQLWQQAVDAAQDALEYQLDRVAQRLDASDTLTGRQKLAEQFLQKLAELGLSRLSPIRRGMVVQRLSEMLHLPESDVDRSLRNSTRSRQAQRARFDAQGPVSGVEGGEMAPNFSDEKLANARGGSSLAALERAERQVLGALMRDPDLFHQPLIDGRALDEALTPSEVVTDAGRSVYALLYDRLAEGEAVTLASLLSLLAERGQQKLCDLLTQAEAEVEALAGEDPQKLQSVLQQAVAAIHEHYRRQDYRKTRQALDDGINSSGDLAQLQRRLSEHLLNHPSPVRFPRARR